MTWSALQLANQISNKTALNIFFTHVTSDVQLKKLNNHRLKAGGLNLVIDN